MDQHTTQSSKTTLQTMWDIKTQASMDLKYILETPACENWSVRLRTNLSSKLGIDQIPGDSCEKKLDTWEQQEPKKVQL